MKTYKNSHLESVNKAMMEALTPETAKTMRALSTRLQCSFFAAKRRLAEWQKQSGMKLKTTMKREGEKGPASKAYYLDL